MRILLICSFFLSSVCQTSASNEGYFQQEVNYNVNVSLNDKKHKLSGFGRNINKYNSLRIKHAFRKSEKLNLTIKTKIENPNQTQILFFPVVGWNMYNNTMGGAVFHNISFHEKPFEYVLMPLYSFGTKNLNGGGNISYHFYPSSIYNKITLRTGICHYAFANDTYENSINNFNISQTLKYTKLDSRIIFSLIDKNSSERISNEISLRNIIINRDIPYFINYKFENKTFTYWQASYLRENKNPLNKFSQKATLTFNEKISAVFLEAKNFFNYGTPSKGFTTRIFTGFTSLSSGSTFGIDYHMNVSGKDGYRDYLFDEVFPGRTESDGILSRQFVNDYAGFKTPTSFYRESQKWMTGINITTTLPGIIPFRLFVNTAFFDGSDLNGLFGKASWEIGVDLPVIKDIFVIYLPFAYSEDIKYAIDQQKFNTGDLIRFELHLNMLSPIEFIKSIHTR